MKIAIIGLGHQAIDDHIPAAIASPDIEVVGVVEKEPQKLSEFKKSHPDIEGFDTVDALLKHKKPDFVIIAVPHNSHFEVTKEILEHKIHVLKEKPFAMSLKDARALKTIADKSEAPPAGAGGFLGAAPRALLGGLSITR